MASSITGWTDDGAAESLALRTAAAYAGIPHVEAVALGGSRAGSVAEPGSDVDLYVYANVDLPMAARAVVGRASASRVEIGNRFFEPGDEWVDAASGIHVDTMFRHTRWIEEELDRVLVRHQAALGYTTALWHNVQASRPLFDRSGWFGALQARARVAYPEGLRRAIVARNHPLLRRNLSCYLVQLQRAAERGDQVSVNHRVAAFLASWFDILFAVNRQPHPGEKRLAALAEARCPMRPPRLAEEVSALLSAAGREGSEVVARAVALAEGLDAILRAEGLLEPG